MPSDIYHVEHVDNNNSDWNILLAQSPQSTPFVRDDYLGVVGYVGEKYLVYRDDRLYMGLCIPLEKSTGKPEGSVPFAPHQGLLYLNEFESYKNRHNNLEATEVLSDYLYTDTDFPCICFGNSYKVKDIRALQWHHYHSPFEGVYQFEINWTSIINNSEPYELSFASQLRRRDYRHSTEKYGLAIKESNDISDFILLYEQTFSRQQIVLSDETMRKVVGLANLGLEMGFGKLVYAVDEDGNAIDALYILTENHKSYYLFGANSPEHRNKGGGTLLMMDELLNMNKNNIHEFDFIGINSPNRGDFKLSFGGSIEPYYICSVNYSK